MALRARFAEAFGLQRESFLPPGFGFGLAGLTRDNGGRSSSGGTSSAPHGGDDDMDDRMVCEKPILVVMVRQANDVLWRAEQRISSVVA